MKRTYKYLSKKSIFLFFILLNSPALVSATNIFFENKNIIDNVWETKYTLVNYTLDLEIKAFSVFFDFNLYENITSPLSPSDWETLVIQSDLILPDDGFYDAQSLNSGLGLKKALTGFSVQFTYLGPGEPGQQPFVIFDPLTFNEIELGTTKVAPLPGSVYLLLTGLISLYGIRGRRVTQQV